MAIDKINRVVLSSEVKNDLDSKATKVELQNLKSEFDNQINEVYSNILRKPSVPTYEDLYTVYPDAKEGWTATVDDTNITYQFDEDTNEWFATSINALPKATSELDGLMTKEDKNKLDSIQPNAEKNKPTSEIFEEIKSMDGSGSLLDADMLDGKHASDFAEVGHNHDGLYYKKQEVDILLNGKVPNTVFNSHTNNEEIHASKEEKSKWNEAYSKSHIHLNEDTLNKITSTGSESSFNLSEFVTKDEISDLGYGDMLKSVYDKNNDGKIDLAENAEKLGGKAPSEFAEKDHKHNISDIANLQVELDSKETPSGAQNKVNAHASLTNNPHNVTKAQIGLGNVDNVKQATKTEFDSHVGDNSKHVSDNERKNWNNNIAVVSSTQPVSGFWYKEIN